MTIEVSAKKVDDAIKEGLKTLHATIDQVRIDIVSQGGLFKKAKIKMSIGDDEPVAEAAEKAASQAAQAPAEKAAAHQKTAQAQPMPQKTAQKPVETAPERAARPERDQAQQRQAGNGQPTKPDGQRAPREAGRNERAPRREEAVELTPEIVESARGFLSEVLRLMNVEASLKIEEKGRELLIDVVTDNSAVIGYRGETLDALEYLTSLAAGKGDERYVKVRVDCNDYRAKREESLTALAKRMADKCASTGRKVTLESMSSAHRRIIHAALGDDDRVITKSEGKDPNRRVIILPKRK